MQLHTAGHTKDSLFVIAGSFFILTGLLFNEWLLAALFSSDGTVAPSHIIIIRATELFCIVGGVLLVRYRRSLPAEVLGVILGTVLILAGIFLFGKLLPIVTETRINDQNRLILRIVEAFFIISGVMAILWRKSLDLKNTMLFGMSGFVCFSMFMGYDYLASYSRIMMIRSVNSGHVADNVSARLLVKDDMLGWKPKAGSTVRYAEDGAPEALYEIDENGFRKTGNTAKDPAFGIYFFGDSFTFGHGVNNGETFADIIKQNYLPEDVNVYNAGVNGYGIVQIVQRFLDMKERIRPGDVVILTPISEDIKRNLTDFQFPYFIKFTNIAETDHYPFYKDGKITSRKLEDTFLNRLRLVALSARYTGDLFKLARNMFISDTTKEALEMIQIVERETTMRGGKFVLLFLPKTGEAVNRSYSVDISAFNYLDIMMYFPSEEPEMDKLRLSRGDHHWNAQGHKIAARAIVDTLIRNNIIDRTYLVFSDESAH